jgi:hypothetical protein
VGADGRHERGRTGVGRRRRRALRAADHHRPRRDSRRSRPGFCCASENLR